MTNDQLYPIIDVSCATHYEHCIFDAVIYHALNILSEQLTKNDAVLPTLAKDRHSKISSGSALIELSCSQSQGRYLQAC